MAHTAHAWLQDALQRVFTSIDFAAGPSDAQTVAKLFFQGIMGAFLGAQDAVFMVLESRKIGADNFALYTVAKEFTANNLLGYTYVHLDTGDSAATLWPGPPANQMLEEAEYDVEGNLVEKEVEAGLGLALVGTQQGSLLLVLVPDVSNVAEDEDLLPCSVQSEMQLLESERISQVRAVVERDVSTSLRLCLASEAARATHPRGACRWRGTRWCTTAKWATRRTASARS